MNKKGFTLVEMLVSISIFLLLMGAILPAFFQSWKGSEKISSRAELFQIKEIIWARMAREIRSADKILSQSTSSEVFLQTGGNVVSYSLVNNKVRRKIGGYTAYFTNEGEIKSLIFYYPAEKTVELFIDGQKGIVGLRN